MTTIFSAAIMFPDGEVLEGYVKSYGYLNSLANKLSYETERIYGFITSENKFVLQDEAAEIAFDSGQIKEKTDMLAPEDLWPKLESENAY